MIIIDGKVYDNFLEANKRLLEGRVKDIEMWKDISHYELPDLVFRNLTINNLSRENVPKFIGKKKEIRTSLVKIENEILEFIPKGFQSANFEFNKKKHIDTFGDAVAYFGEQELLQHNVDAYRKIGLSVADAGEFCYDLLKTNLLDFKDLGAMKNYMDMLLDEQKIPMEVLSKNKELLIYMFYSKRPRNIEMSKKKNDYLVVCREFNEDFIVHENLLPFLNNSYINSFIKKNVSRIKNIEDLLSDKFKDVLSIDMMNDFDFNIDDILKVHGNDFFNSNLAVSKICEEGRSDLFNHIEKVCINLLIKRNFSLKIVLGLFNENKIDFKNSKDNEIYKGLFLTMNENPLYSCEEALRETKKRYILFHFS